MIALSLPYISFFSTLLGIKNIFVCTKKLCNVSLKEILKISSRLSIITDIERIVLGKKNLYVYRTPLPCNFCRGRSLNKSIIWGQLFSELSYHKSLNSTQSFSLQIYSEKCFHQTHKSVIRRTHFIAELYFSGTKKKGRYI